MPAVSFPSPLLTGTLDSTAYKDFFIVDPTSDTNNTMENLNGRLDEGNAGAAADFTVQREHVQPGAGIRTWGASGSLNLDYFTDTWGYNSTPTAGTDRAESIPGAGRRFYLPFEATVLFMWQLSWAASIGRDEDSWLTIGRLDGVLQGPTRRNLRRNIETNGRNSGYRSSRQYTGHWHDRLNPGWHDFNMLILPAREIAPPATPKAFQSRIWCRNLIVLALNRPD